MNGQAIYRQAEVARVCQILYRWQRGAYSWKTVVGMIDIRQELLDRISESVHRTMPWDHLQQLVYLVMYPDEKPRLKLYPHE